MFQSNHTLIHAFGNSNQIIDVTEQCDFEWYIQPKPCKAYLEVSDATGDFTEGETIENVTDGTSTAKVFSSYIDGNRVYIEDISGSFNHGDQIKGNTSGQTAIVDNFVEERSWPDNIVEGSFLDSVISKDVDDYLEFESSLEGAGFVMKLMIRPREEGLYTISCLMGVGVKVQADVFTRRLHTSVCPYSHPAMYSGEIKQISYTHFNTFMCQSVSPLYGYLAKDGTGLVSHFLCSFYQSGKGTFRWRIHSIRVFKIIV